MVERNTPSGQNKTEADEAMEALRQIFSSPEIIAKARLRCGVGGPTAWDVFFESVLDDVFGRDPNSNYKCWIRRLYHFGLISTMPDEWKSPP
jgi:hypothetical protein